LKDAKYKGWIAWSVEQCEDMLMSHDKDAEVRAQYRLGQLEQESGNLQKSLQYFYQVQRLDPHFCADIVNLRIAEVCYKMDETEKAL
jgi:lipopolysaccharide biosynthesis regulator YciM